MSALAALMGIAKPRPSALPATAVLIPTTAPLASRSGPPLLPGLIAASVWMRSWSCVGRPVSSSVMVISRPVADGVPGGQHEDRQIRLGSANPAGDVEAGHVGQADVEDDDVDPRCVLGDRSARFTVAGDVDDMTVLFEQPLEDPGEAFIVLDDEDVHPLSLSLSDERDDGIGRRHVVEGGDHRAQGVGTP